VNGILVAVILLLGAAVIVVRRRTVAIALVSAQSLVLGAGALQVASEHSGELLTAGIVLITKAIALPLLLLAVIRQTREPRLVAPAIPGLVRLAGAGAVALAVTMLVSPMGLGDQDTEHVAITLVLLGVAIVAARRPAFLQLMGVIVAENGVALLAVSVPGGLSYVVELGALVDLVLVVVVAAAFTQRIHLELGTGDTELLRSLRD
jgi:hydrogenase-4 component E